MRPHFSIFGGTFFLHIFESSWVSLFTGSWSESHIFQFMHRQKTPFFTFLKQSFFSSDPEFSTISEPMHPILKWACFGIFTIYALIYGHLLLKWIRLNTGDAIYVTDPSIIVTQKLPIFWNSNLQNVTIFAFHRKVKIGVSCLCIVWKSEILIETPVNRKTKESPKPWYLILHWWEAFMNLIAGSLCIEFLSVISWNLRVERVIQFHWFCIGCSLYVTRKSLLQCSRLLNLIFQS